MLALFDLNQLRFQHGHSNLAVLMLAAFLLAGYDHSGRNVGDTDGRFGLVDVLTACTTGTVSIHLQVRGFDLNVGAFVQLRHDLNGCEGSMAFARWVEGRNTNQTMNTGFGFQEAVGIGAVDGDRQALDACLLAGEVVQNFGFHTVSFCPAVVHTVEHFHPVLRLGATCARMEGHDGRVVVIVAGKQSFQLLLLDGFVDLSNGILQFAQHGFVLRSLQFDQFHHGHGIIIFTNQLLKVSYLIVDLFLQFQDLLGILKIVPETRCADFQLKLLFLIEKSFIADGGAQILQPRLQ